MKDGFNKQVARILAITTVIIAFAITIILLGSGDSSADTIIVDDGGEGNYTSIQEAINGATPGDLIRVWAGTYNEDIEVDKSLDLAGNGSSETKIDNEDAYVFGVWINVDYVNFSGFAVINCDRHGIRVDSSHNNIFDNELSDNARSGIALTTTSEAGYNNLSGNTVANNGNHGVMVESDTGQNLISGNTIYSNTNRGISLNKVPDNLISGNTIYGNDHGIFFSGSSNNNIVRYNIVHNNTDSGMTISGSDNHLYNNVVENNDVGIDVAGADDLAIMESDVLSNRIGIKVRNTAESLDIRNCYIKDNYEIGVDASGNNDFSVIATYNWWGNASGPYHSSGNANGTGDNITDYVAFNPWSGVEVMAIIDSISPNPALDTDTVFFKTHGRTPDDEMVRFIWRSSIDGEFYNDTESGFSDSSLSLGTHTVFFRVQNTTGTWSDEINTTMIIHEKPVAYIDSILPSPAFDTEDVNFEGHGTDDGSIERYAWRSSVDGEFYNGSESELDYGDLSVGSHDIYLKVLDDMGKWSEEDSTTLVIRHKPVAFIDSILPSPAMKNETVNFTGHGTDDGTITRYAWRSSEDGELHNDSSPGFNTSSLSLGDHTIYFRVRDDEGVWSEEVSESLSILQRPVAIIVDISPNPANDSDSVTFTAGGTDDGTLTRYAWRSSLYAFDTFYNGSSDKISWDKLPIGNQTIFLKIQDDDGLWSDEVNTTLVITEDAPPNKKPLVNIASPANNSRVTGIVNISGSASDDDGNETVRKVEVSINDGNWTNCTGNVTWNFLWNATGMPSGEYIFRFRAYDGMNYSELATLTLDLRNETANIPPVVNVTGPPANSRVFGVVTITGTAEDANGDETIDKVKISVNDGEWVRVSGLTSWKYNWNTTGLDQGNYILKFRASDGEENSEVAELVLEVVNISENVKPVVTVDSPASYKVVNGTVEITGTVYDDNGNWTLEEVEFSLDGGDWKEVTYEKGTTGWNYYWYTPLVDNGDHTLEFRAYDGVAYSDIVELILDVQNVVSNNLPVVTIVNPLNSQIVSGTVEINGTATDQDGQDTLVKVEISIDGGDVWTVATGTSAWSYQWDTTKVTNGDYLVRVRAYDGIEYSGVMDRTVRVKNIVQNIKPTLTIITPTSGSKVSDVVNISGTATDPDGIVMRIEISFNSGTWINVTGTNQWSFFWYTNSAEKGSYEVKIRAYDGEEYSDIVTISLVVEDSGGDDDDPGFGAALFLMAFASVSIAILDKRRKKTP